MPADDTLLSIVFQQRRSDAPANDKVGIIILLRPNVLPTLSSPASVHSGIFVFWVRRQIQPSFPLFVHVRLVSFHKTVHADAHHVTSAHALANTKPVNTSLID